MVMHKYNLSTGEVEARSSGIWSQSGSTWDYDPKQQLMKEGEKEGEPGVMVHAKIPVLGSYGKRREFETCSAQKS